MPVDEEEMLAVGALKASSKERQRIAKVSRNYVCKTCAHTNQELIKERLLAQQTSANSEAANKPEDELAKQDAGNGDDVEKRLKAKLENGVTLGEIAQIFMLEANIEKQDQMMVGNTFKLPTVVDAAAGDKATDKAKKVEERSEERQIKREEEEDSSNQASDNDDEVASNTSEKLLDEIEDFIDASLLKKINKNQMEMEITAELTELEAEKFKFIKEQKKKINQLQEKLGQVMETSREIRQKSTLIEGQPADRSSLAAKNVSIDKKAVQGSELAQKTEGKNILKSGIVDQGPREKKDKAGQDDAEGLDKEDSQAIKAIEKQLLDANRILLDINTKIKDVFDGDQSRAILGISEQKMEEYRSKNSELAAVLQQEIDLQEQKNKHHIGKLGKGDSKLKMAKELLRK